MTDLPTDDDDDDRLDLMYRQLITAWRKMAEELAEALRFHEDRRANPTSRGGPALARYNALNDSDPPPVPLVADPNLLTHLIQSGTKVPPRAHAARPLVSSTQTARSHTREAVDLVGRYVRFIFAEYEEDPRGWITKNPPSVAEFATRYDNVKGG